MTVQELIDKLQALPEEVKSLDVWTQGCDCDAEAKDVEVDYESIVVPEADPYGNTRYMTVDSDKPERVMINR